MITGNEPIASTPAHKKYNGFGETWVDGSDGLTIRQHFAAMAMQGLWAGINDDNYENYGRIAEMAVLQADALIAELNKESK